MIKICLDAGHYGKYNQSPANKKYFESEAMWKLTEYLKEELLTYKDVHVITTRKDQAKDLALYSRGQRAKDVICLYPIIVMQSVDKLIIMWIMLLYIGHIKIKTALMC